MATIYDILPAGLRDKLLRAAGHTPEGYNVFCDYVGKHAYLYRWRLALGPGGPFVYSKGAWPLRQEAVDDAWRDYRKLDSMRPELDDRVPVLDIPAVDSGVWWAAPGKPSPQPDLTPHNACTGPIVDELATSAYSRYQANRIARNHASMGGFHVAVTKLINPEGVEVWRLIETECPFAENPR